MGEIHLHTRVISALPEEDLGLCPNPLRKLLERSFLRTFKNFQQGDFCPLLFVVRILMQPYTLHVFRLLRAKSRPAGFVRLRSLRYRVEVVEKLHLNRAERHMGRSIRILSFGRANFLKKRVVGNDLCVVPPSHQLISMPFLSGSGEKRQAVAQIPLVGIWLGAAGIRSTATGCIGFRTIKKTGAKIPFIKVLAVKGLLTRSPL